MSKRLIILILGTVILAMLWILTLKDLYIPVLGLVLLVIAIDAVYLYMRLKRMKG